jgi:two-component system KDP operon response regulator KdpE
MATSRNRRVLIAEDELHELLAEAIRVIGDGEYSVATATRGDEAVRKAAALRPAAIIMDLRLPGMDGVEAIRQIRRFSDVPILAWTAYSDEFRKGQVMDAGATDYMMKGDIERLVEWIERVTC